jgi:hypothetical protein
MSTARGWYERMGCLFSFAQTAFGFRVRVTPSGGLSATYCRQGVRHATQNLEAWLTRKEPNFDDSTRLPSLFQVASQGQ